MKRLEIAELPKDKGRSLSKFNKELCVTVNYCKAYPEKINTLADVLEYTLNRIRGEKVQVAPDVPEVQEEPEVIVEDEATSPQLQLQVDLPSLEDSAE